MKPTDNAQQTANFYFLSSVFNSLINSTDTDHQFFTAKYSFVGSQLTMRRAIGGAVGAIGRSSKLVSAPSLTLNLTLTLFTNS